VAAEERERGTEAMATQTTALRRQQAQYLRRPLVAGSRKNPSRPRRRMLSCRARLGMGPRAEVGDVTDSMVENGLVSDGRKLGEEGDRLWRTAGLQRGAEVWCESGVDGIDSMR
jgi:hypothetical protein